MQTKAFVQSAATGPTGTKLVTGQQAGAPAYTPPASSQPAPAYGQPAAGWSPSAPAGAATTSAAVSNAGLLVVGGILAAISAVCYIVQFIASGLTSPFMLIGAICCPCIALLAINHKGDYEKGLSVAGFIMGFGAVVSNVISAVMNGTFANVSPVTYILNTVFYAAGLYIAFALAMRGAFGSRLAGNIVVGFFAAVAIYRFMPAAISVFNSVYMPTFSLITWALRGPCLDVALFLITLGTEPSRR